MAFKDLINSCEAASPYHMPPRAEIREIAAQHEGDGHRESCIIVPVKIDKGGRHRVSANQGIRR
jgi:hypothetical protein